MLYAVFILLFHTAICGDYNNGNSQNRRIENGYQNYKPGYYENPGVDQVLSRSSSSVISSSNANAMGSNSYVFNPTSVTSIGAYSKAYSFSLPQGNSDASTRSASGDSKALVYIVSRPPRPLPKREYHHINLGRSGWQCNGDKNATFKPCPDPCPGTCRNPQGVEFCYAMCEPYGCECNPGFVLSEKGLCILYQDCPGVLCNGDRNATYKACPDPCPSTCELLGKTRVCARKCKPYGCECKSGYHLNAKGKCVYVQDCPGALCKGDKNATYVQCPNPCPKTCDDPKGPDVCSAMCLSHGCQCNEGYYLNSCGKCVLLEDCLGCNGDRNATYSECPSICPKTCKDPKGPEVCPAVCGEPGCECHKDYFLNSDGKCVLLEDCPGCNGDRNATYSECPSKCPKTCKDPHGPDVCPAVCGEPGCECHEDYYLNNDGKCVLLEDCPGCNGDRNATYSECPSKCPKTCKDPQGPDVCPAVCGEPGCECHEDYFLDNDGKCVLLEDCPGCNGDRNATYSECPSKCPKTCKDPHGPDVCPAVCGEPGCECHEDYYLNNDGKCVLLEDCPGCNGDRNATYSECPSKCPKTCKDPQGPDVCPAVCGEPGCECHEDYFLDNDGKCVLLEDCPGCNGDRNATYSECPSKCPKTCKDPHGPDVCPAVCGEPGCECHEDYYLNNDGKCVLLEDCPGCNGDRNATYSECPSKCPKTCKDPQGPDVCPAVCGEPGCECHEDYFLDNDGKCVLLEDCPGCNGDRNATYSECPSKCPKTCKDPHGPDVCPAVCGEPGCECHEDYYLNNDGKCVLLEDCPGCNGDRNATYSECPSKCPKTCKDPQGPDVCPAVCGEPGCECHEDYFLDNDGKCVLLEDCPGCNGDRNATYSECPSKCPKTCKDPHGPDVCPAVCGEPGCECHEDYYLNNDGKCVLLEDCPGCNGDRNATYSECPSKCPKTCKDPQGPDVCPAVCGEPGCECHEDYFLDNDGKCVLLEDCPGCNGDRNATYSECPSKCPKTCKDPHGPDVCPAVCGEPGCECHEDYYLNNDGKCVLLEDCPGCNGDRNATYSECPSKCPKTCKDPQGPDVCPAVCGEPGCECHEDYFLDNDGKCVLLEDCPGCNGDRNATYSECPSKCPKTCKDPHGPDVCPAVCGEPGCECHEDYYLNNDGKCVLLEDCPGCNGDRNATYSECPSKCPKTCKDPHGPDVCPAICGEPGCECHEDYFLNNDGKCVLLEDCPGCNGDRNATYSECPSKCPKTCKDPHGPDVCPAVCGEPGCECHEDYYLNNDGKCVLLEDCPGCNGDRNATYSECPSKCPKTCKDPHGPDVCPAVCGEPGCECHEDYYLNNDGKCVLLEDCPGCNGDRNATYSECPSKCPKTCKDPHGPDVCPAVCGEPGCECHEDYFLNNDGKCVLLEDCPGCNGDRNATYSECPSKCPKTCKDPHGPDVCPAVCGEPGCECHEDYFLNNDGKCVLLEDCPGCNGDQNATYSECPSKCPKTCKDPHGPDVCPAVCGEPGCECHEDYFLNNDGKCVLLEDCPGCNGDRNATYSECPSKCPKTCKDPHGPDVCPAVCGEPGCECNGGYFLNSDGKCVLLEDCLVCSPNATYKECRSACPKTCDDPKGPDACTDNCKEPGCECDEGYYLTPCGRCVLLEDCPGCKGDLNATFSENSKVCSKTCDNPKGLDVCPATYPDCVCKEGYYLNYDGKCVLLEDCSGCKGDANATFSECPSICPKTCDDPEGSDICAAVCGDPGCICNEGFYLNSDGKCVLLEDCPGCKGNLNATYKECPNPCPRTCELPSGPELCNKACLAHGYECNQGYYLNDKGDCVKLQDCPGAKLCTTNETFVFCKGGCQTHYCLEDDSSDIIACDLPYPCYSECVCKGDYLRLSYEDNTCILANLDVCANLDFIGTIPLCVPEKECAPLECGYNEMPVECKTACPPQFCNISYTDYFCTDDIKCEPGCDCLPNHLRNDSGLCIFNEDCPPHPGCEVPPDCRKTCYNPNPAKCPVVEPPIENQNGCKCKDGYILSSTEGECIKYSECPVSEGCNGDPNAVITECPWPCPSTCQSPHAGFCGKSCSKVGCQCRPGLILSEENGKCIFPEECPYGNPCGANGTFADCSFRCPDQYCPKDDSRAVYACKPGRLCPPGCMCKDYYKIASSEDDSCILAKDCATITCTRPDEQYNPCTNSCLAEDCTDIGLKYHCEADPEECIPKCVCYEGYYRNMNGDCVPKSYCPNQCDVDQKCRSTCAVPNPPYCEYIPPSETNNECNCQKGYILDKVGGKCIKIEDCPSQSCNGDSNARIKACPKPCPSTCEAPDEFPCKKKRMDVGCECLEGYLLSKDGYCILPDQCEGGNPCGENATFVPCRYDCLSNFCAVDDSRDVVVCENTDCFSGCICKLNHRRLSLEEPRCILSTDCPPINCTCDYEEYNPCPSPCSSGYCEDVDKGPVTCNTLVLNCNPQCTCIDGYYRNPSTHACVSADECRKINNEHRKKNI